MPYEIQKGSRKKTSYAEACWVGVTNIAREKSRFSKRFTDICDFCVLFPLLVHEKDMDNRVSLVGHQSSWRRYMKDILKS